MVQAAQMSIDFVSYRGYTSDIDFIYVIKGSVDYSYGCLWSIAKLVLFLQFVNVIALLFPTEVRANGVISIVCYKTLVYLDTNKSRANVPFMGVYKTRVFSK